MASQRDGVAQLVGRQQPLGHGAAAALALLRERRGPLLQARHHARRHAHRRRAAARCRLCLWGEQYSQLLIYFVDN